jgi:hypothetical protein
MMSSPFDFMMFFHILKADNFSLSGAPSFHICTPMSRETIKAGFAADKAVTLLPLPTVGTLKQV